MRAPPPAPKPARAHGCGGSRGAQDRGRGRGAAALDQRGDHVTRRGRGGREKSRKTRRRRGAKDRREGGDREREREKERAWLVLRQGGSTRTVAETITQLEHLLLRNGTLAPSLRAVGILLRARAVLPLPQRYRIEVACFVTCFVQQGRSHQRLSQGLHSCSLMLLARLRSFVWEQAGF